MIKGVWITLRRDKCMWKAVKHSFSNSAISFSPNVEITIGLIRWKVDSKSFPTVYGFIYKSFLKASDCVPKIALQTPFKFLTVQTPPH